MTRLIALDTETTGLDPFTEEIFEIATIDMETKEERVWTIEPSPHVIAVMHPKAAEVNRYHERTAEEDWTWDLSWNDRVLDNNAAFAVLNEISGTLHDAHVIGAVPDFDTRFLTQLFTDHGMDVPRWHYHLLDIENIAVGWLMYARLLLTSGLPTPEGVRRLGELKEVLALPYDSDALAEACGVATPGDDERHTALGDARMVVAWWEKLNGFA